MGNQPVRIPEAPSTDPHGRSREILKLTILQDHNGFFRIHCETTEKHSDLGVDVSLDDYLSRWSRKSPKHRTMELLKFASSKLEKALEKDKAVWIGGSFTDEAIGERQPPGTTNMEYE